MKQVQINDFLSTKISSEYNTIISVDIDDKPFAIGGFGEVYHCYSLNGNKLSTPQVIKIFIEKYPGSADSNFNTIRRLQKKFDKLNQELVLQQTSLLKKYPAFSAIPQFSFIGDLNGRIVKGYSSDNLKIKNYFEFEDILTDAKLLDNFYKIPVPRRIYFAFQLVSAFKILDDFKYIHADLKPGAIFLNLDNQSLSIIDYDSGVITETLNDEPTTWGAPNDWVAPEIWTQQINIVKGDKIRVDSFTDKWSVAVGVNYLITGIHPLFYLKELGPGITKQYFNSTQWPDANTNANYFEKENELYYHQYINFINTEIPSQIKDKIHYTINFGYKNPAARTSYYDWEKSLLSIQKPPTLKFLTVSKKEILKGENIVLAWNAENAISVEIENVGIFSSIDKKSIKPDKSCTYIINFKGYYGELVEKFEIKVSPAPLFKIVEADNIKLKRGNSTSLKWEIENTSKINLWGVENDSILIPSKGHRYIIPDKTTTYKFEAIAIDNTTVFEKSIIVEVFDEGKILFFIADRQFVLQTMPVELSWETENAIKVEIDGIGEVELAGSIKVEPFSDTKYKLIVTDQFGKIEKHIQIKILPLPLIEKVIAQTPIIVSENVLRINLPDFSNVSNKYPSTIKFKEFDFTIKLDSKTFIKSPKPVNLSYSIKQKPFIEKIQRIFEIVKNEFKINKLKKHVSKK